MLVDQSCPFCEEEETIVHMIFRGQWKTQVWFIVLGLQMDGMPLNSLSGWLEQVGCAGNLAMKEIKEWWAKF